MSDTSQALDAKRPWITDERELPSHMNWARTLFDPTGESPQLHFTRAWTLLFMVQLLIILLPFMLALVINLAGGNGKPVGAFGVYATPVVFIATTLVSYVIHSRRLNDAGKPQLLAVIPLIPLILAAGFFVITAQSQSAQYDKRFETRQEYLADPDAFRAKQRAEQEKAKEEAEARAAEAEANGEESETGQAQPQGQRGRGGPGGGTANLDEPLPPKAEAVLKASLPMFQNIMIPLSGLIAIWSLLWVARAPFRSSSPSLLYERDSIVYALTSFEGRLSRKRFWLAYLAFIFASLGLGFVGGLLGLLSPIISTVWLLGISVVQMIMAVALFTKRLHDMGRSGWLQLIPYIAIVLVLVVLALIALVSGVSFADPPGWFIVMYFISTSLLALMSLAFFLWVGLSPHMPRDNKYGPAPEVVPPQPEGDSAYA